MWDSCVLSLKFQEKLFYNRRSDARKTRKTDKNTNKIHTYRTVYVSYMLTPRDGVIFEAICHLQPIQVGYIRGGYIQGITRIITVRQRPLDH